MKQILERLADAIEAPAKGSARRDALAEVRELIEQLADTETDTEEGADNA